MKGCYCLIINLNEEKTIRIGKKLGKIEFKSGRLLCLCWISHEFTYS